MQTEPIRYGIDLGGTKTEIIALTPKGFEIARTRVPSATDYAGTIQTLCDLIRDQQAALGPGTVGIGIPGTLSPQTGLVKNANSTWLIGHPLGQDLQATLGQPIRIANDADCLALSESMDGAAAGAATAFAVILGTGVGGGLIAHGRILTGPNAIGGEWGHNPLPWPIDTERPGPPCYCGQQGCIETFLSGPGLQRDHQAHTGQILAPLDIAKAAEAGDHRCQESMVRYSQRLARALASLINVFDPEVIVLGGGLSNLKSLYQTVPELWGQWVFSDQVLTRLEQAQHGDSSGVRGAAWLWDQGQADRIRSVE